MSWLVAPEELTPEQVRAIELDASQHRVIVGGPGSGKTQVLLYRAQNLRERHNVRDDRFRVFVFTNVLKEYIRSALNLLDLPEESVSTLHAWCLEEYRRRVSMTVPRANGRGIDFRHIVKGVLDSVRGSLFHEPPFDFVVVDEGQDLEPDAIQLLGLMSHHVTVCADRKQQIYEGGATEPEIIRALGLRSGTASFLDAFRCCPFIAQTAAVLVDDRQEAERYVRQVRVGQGEREKVLLYIATDFEDEKRRLIEVVLGRQARGERVGILFPSERQVFGFAEGLTGAGIEVEVRAKYRSSRSYQDLDFTSDRAKVLTYHSAKGLTFDSVLMPRLVGRSFGRRTDQETAKLMFVAITRATRWVYMSTVKERDELPAVSALRREAARPDAPIVVRLGGLATSTAAPAPRRTAGDDDLLDPL